MATLNPNLPELATLLRKAAAFAAANGVSPDDFAQAAWHAYLDNTPDLREALEVRALAARLGELRDRGLVGQA